MCLPCRFGPGDVFGPGHQQALRLLRSASHLPRTELTAMIRRRTEVPEAHWRRARDQVYQQSVEFGFPFRADGVLWEAVAAAENAAQESPTDPALADALRGAAAVIVFADELEPVTAATLAGPWGRSLAPARPSSR